MGHKNADYERLVTAYSADLYRYAFWLCKDPVQSEDLVQEVCLRAWKSLDNLKNRGAPKPWLFAILRNEYTRQFARRRPGISEVDLEQIESRDVANDTSTEAFVLRQALDMLAVEYREPLLLQVLGGFSCEEIAEICGISKGAAMTRLFRAKQRLREVLVPESESAE
ncbi:MAG: sigma-70 family RNA polymerase sigma factor [Methylococcaceae bacterium]|nr:sigma-70 family RNA polymerase sigma factor [Methylococcaceae bacterium]MCI0733562.1 sigma-70 family RNA polymerase sigma factor [Methylococcaceae bacterium]